MAAAVEIVKSLPRTVDVLGVPVATSGPVARSLDVRGMTCASCVSHVEGALTELDGVLAAVG